MSLKDSIRVMVVDDMATSRGLITQALDWMGVTHYSTANEGASALRALAASPVHLVISDYNMPGMNGLELLKGLRLNRTTQQIGFILVSGKPDANVIQAGQKLAMNNFIQKPFTPEAMKACIERVVGRL